MNFVKNSFGNTAANIKIIKHAPLKQNTQKPLKNRYSTLLSVGYKYFKQFKIPF